MNTFLSSQRCWPYGQRRLHSTTSLSDIANSTRTIPRNLNGSNKSEYSTVYVNPEVSTRSAAPLSIARKCHSSSYNGIKSEWETDSHTMKHSLKTSTSSNETYTLPTSSGHFANSADKFAILTNQSNSKPGNVMFSKCYILYKNIMHNNQQRHMTYFKKT